MDQNNSNLFSNVFIVSAEMTVSGKLSEPITTEKTSSNERESGTVIAVITH